MMRFLQGTISYPEVKWGTREARAAKNTPLVDFVEQLAGVGADGIELWGRHLEDLDEREVEALAAAIEDSGQKVVVLAPYWDFSSGDEAVEESLADAERYLGLKDVFGARRIRVFSGAPASAEATAENWERAVNGLGRLARMYDGSGVTFVIETHGQQLADTPKSSARLMEELEEPTIRLNYQSMRGEPSEELDVIYPWVAHVHVSPTSKYADNVEGIIRALAMRGYDGTVTVEFCTDSLPAENEEFDREKAIAGMRADIRRLRKVVS
jgi:sugar phosphate isomerase/epimerase